MEEKLLPLSARMPGGRLARWGGRLAGIAAAAAVLAAATPDYFPLEVGNQWIYRVSGAIAGPPVVVEVAGTEAVAGRVYARVRGLDAGTQLLRMAEDGTAYVFDAESRQERVWAAFSTPEGGSYRTSANPCNSIAIVRSRDAKVKTPVGDVTGALAVNYPTANCADAGLVSDTFLPWIGLVRRESLTIAGPRVMELMYSRTGGVTVLSEPEAAFTLSLDRARYGHPRDIPAMTARLTLRATASDPVELVFPSGQRYDLAIRDETGKLVYQWSEGKAFTTLFGREVFTGERNYVVVVELKDSRGAALPPGRYTAEAWLATQGEKRYAASVGFEIAALR